MNLNQVTIPASIVKDTMVFYQKLGLELIVDALPNYVRLKCPVGNSTLSIHKVDKELSEPGIYIYFELENLDQKVEELQHQGIAFDELPEDKTWLWREARLKDPAGNQVILYFAGENRLDPPWKVKQVGDL
jgi:hypothetical protein